MHAGNSMLGEVALRGNLKAPSGPLWRLFVTLPSCCRGSGTPVTSRFEGTRRKGGRLCALPVSGPCRVAMDAMGLGGQQHAKPDVAST